MLQRDYGAAEEEQAQPEVSTASKFKQKEVIIPPSTLPGPVQELLRLIFDVKMMAESMIEIGYDGILGLCVYVYMHFDGM